MVDQFFLLLKTNMIYFFIRVHTATLFSVCLALNKLTPKIEARTFQSQNNENNSSDETFVAKNEEKQQQLHDNISQFHRSMNNEDVKRKLDRFALTKQEARTLAKFFNWNVTNHESKENINDNISAERINTKLKRSFVQNENESVKNKLDQSILTKHEALKLIEFFLPNITNNVQMENFDVDNWDGHPVKRKSNFAPKGIPNNVPKSDEEEMFNIVQKLSQLGGLSLPRVKHNEPVDIQNQEAFGTSQSIDYYEYEVGNSLQNENMNTFNLRKRTTPNVNDVAVAKNIARHNEFRNLRQSIVNKLDRLDKIYEVKSLIPYKGTTFQTDLNKKAKYIENEINENMETLDRLTATEDFNTSNAIKLEVAKYKTKKQPIKSDRMKQSKEISDYASFLNHEDLLINILRKQTNLLKSVAKALDDKDDIRARNDFDNLLSDLEKKKLTLHKGTNMTEIAEQTALDNLSKKLNKIDMTTESTVSTVVNMMLPTVKTIFDEVEVRKALKNDPLVQRILKMANRRREQYLKAVEKKGNQFN